MKRGIPREVRCAICGDAFPVWERRPHARPSRRSVRPARRSWRFRARWHVRVWHPEAQGRPVDEVVKHG